MTQLLQCFRSVKTESLNRPAISRLRVDLGTDGHGPDWVEIELRRSRRARRAGLRVRPGTSPEIVLPVRAPVTEAQRLLERHLGWLRQKLRWARGLEQEALGLGLLSPGLVWLEGRPLPLDVLDGLPARANGAGGAGAADGTGADALESWYRDRARTRLSAATAAFAADLAGTGLISRRPGRITIRDPRSRWGSCSARGDISYSWRLVMMPRRALEYVVCHELCHLEVHNHSPRFWRLLDRARPGWRAEAAWLRRYGPMISLHRPDAGPPTAAFVALPGVDQAPPGSSAVR